MEFFVKYLLFRMYEYTNRGEPIIIIFRISLFINFMILVRRVVCFLEILP